MSDRTRGSMQEENHQDERLKNEDHPLSRHTGTKRKRPKEDRRANPGTFRTIKHLYVLLAVLLIVFLLKIQVIDGSNIQISAYNPRLEQAEDQYVRGSIYDADGNVLAYTEVSEDGEKTRVYPYGEVFAHVTGYSLSSKTGLELALNSELLSSSDIGDQIKYLFGAEEIIGNSAVLTLRADLQQAAYDLMGDYAGAVIISEPSTGKILCLVSTPSYDPNTIADDWDALSEDEDSPLYCRALQGQYTPGSTFKIVTALAAYQSGETDFTYTCSGTTELGDSVLSCYGSQAHGSEDISAAFANSCNTYFSNLGLTLGVDAILSAAESLYLNTQIDFILTQSTSKVVLSSGDNTQMIGETAIGQGESEITPFSMNMIVSMIANEGMLYQPYLVDSIIDQNGETVEKNLPKLYDEAALTSEEADFLEELMLGVIESGTGSSLNGKYDCTVYGKTGTAQVTDADSEEDEEAHSWFTGYTKVDGEADIAITVVVEHGAESKTALSIVSSLLSTYYG